MNLNALNCSKTALYGYALVVRVMLLIYGEWQDAHMEVKFTDVDYFVFSDAAEYVVKGEPPYRRATYRYSPILSWLLVPSIYIHKAWGKILFVSFDFVTAILIDKILGSLKCKKSSMQIAVAVWLFNPITMAVSCRGNAESVISCLVIGVIYAFIKKKFVIAGCLYAIAIHMKIYPVIYCLCLVMLCHRPENKFANKTLFQKFIYIAFLPFAHSFWSNAKLLRFIISFLLSFFAVFAWLYKFYDYDFLEHTFLYHILRRDVRHNFSLHFYMMYLNPHRLLGFVSFLSQIVVLVALSIAKFEDPPFCLFILTHTFVTFNKVCTSQYFIWYLSLLALLVPGFANLGKKEIFFPICAWFLGQGFWLHFAYMLEFQGKNSFLMLWVASAVFFFINVSITKWCITSYKCHKYFDCNGKLLLYSNKEY